MASVHAYEVASAPVFGWIPFGLHLGGDMEEFTPYQLDWCRWPLCTYGSDGVGVLVSYCESGSFFDALASGLLALAGL